VKTALAVLALAASAFLAVFAWDVLRWRGELETQDVRFLAAPTQVSFSTPSALIPFGAAERTLDAGDDLAFRKQLQGYARVRPGVAFTPALLALRAETQTGLAELARRDPDARRRSRAANMIGVVALNESLAPRDPEALTNLITGAIGSFRSAVEIDPANADAKANLEQALRIAKAATLGGDAPSGGRNTGEEAGLGQSGSGY
jgi:hypothetical protein